jgi:lipopolysaccharide transport system ATP-binding protein
MSAIIQVENLSKKYIISHQQLNGRNTFRDAMYQVINAFRNKFIHPFSSEISNNPSLEEFWALKEINFEVKSGDRIGIIGRNGAGKTTLLKVLSRITEPTTGRITIKGRIASLLEVGTGFHQELSGRENIYLNGAILGMTRLEIRKKFDEIVDFSGVEKFLDTPVKRYSSGMYVRLAFAVAAHLEPEILVVDEVLAVGDIEFQEKCLGKMHDISNVEGRTVLFVSHNMAAIKNLCPNVIFLESGRIKSQGLADKVIEEYRNLSINEIWDPIVNFPKINSQAYFTSVKMLNNDRIINHFLWEDEKTLSIDFTVNEEISSSYIAVEICNRDNIPILWMSDMETPHFRRRMPGQYSIEFNIPPNILPEGYYSINMGIILLNAKPIQVFHEIYTFRVLDTTSILAMKSIKFPALISLNIKPIYV